MQPRESNPTGSIARRLAAAWLLSWCVVPGAAAARTHNDAATATEAKAATDARTAATQPDTNNADPNASEPVPGPNDEVLYLDVTVNGQRLNKVGEFILRRGMLYIRPREFAELGFTVPSGRLVHGGLVKLSDIPGFAYSLEMAGQTIRITAVDAVLTPTVVHPLQIDGTERQRRIESGTGVTLNYDTVGTLAKAGQGGTGAFDFRGFARAGLIDSTWQLYEGSSLTGSGTKPVVRLDTAYSFADVRSLRRYTAGDYINGALGWQRPVHMEGVQWRSDFSMRPDMITFPLPSITGSAAVPSTVDVLVNGAVVSSTQVDPGPFQVEQLPVISGAGTITMTMTNSLGQQVTVNQPFYGGATLLAKGLQTYSGQAGLVRRYWGTQSDNYGKLGAVGTYRRGLSDRLTVEAAGEATQGTGFGGIGAAAVLGDQALVSVDAAAGRSDAGNSELVSAAVQHIGRTVNLGGSATVATRNFRDLAAENGSGTLRKQLSAYGGVTLRRVGTAGLAYAESNQDAGSGPVTAVSTAQHTKVLTANYAVQIHGMSFYAVEFRSMGQDSSSTLQVGVTVGLGRRRTASASGTSTGTVQMQMQQTPVTIGDWGYQGYSSFGDTQHSFMLGQYKSGAGLVTAGLDNTAGVNTARLETQGAISLIDGAVFPSNTVYDSFAIVDTGPVGHVRVYQENRDVGKTSSAGRLLVPDMRAFDVNHIGIEARDIPVDVSFDLEKRIVRPQDRSGVVVRFPARFSHSALLRLVDADGKPIALGSTATVAATGTVVPVGYDGEAYVENLAQDNVITVERDGHAPCTVAFRYPGVPGDIPTLGPLRCVEKQP